MIGVLVKALFWTFSVGVLTIYLIKKYRNEKVAQAERQEAEARSGDRD
jgi:hypothetical protein